MPDKTVNSESGWLTDLIDGIASDPLLSLLVALFLFWPMIGQWLVIRFDRRRVAQGKKPLIAAAEEPADILARMYLWPVFLYKVKRDATKLDQQNQD